LCQFLFNQDRCANRRHLLPPQRPRGVLPIQKTSVDATSGILIPHRNKGDGYNQGTDSYVGELPGAVEDHATRVGGTVSNFRSVFGLPDRGSSPSPAVGPEIVRATGGGGVA